MTNLRYACVTVGRTFRSPPFETAPSSRHISLRRLLGSEVPVPQQRISTQCETMSIKLHITAPQSACPRGVSPPAYVRPPGEDQTYAHGILHCISHSASKYATQHVPSGA
jgi:hypothetical protein